MFDIAGAGYAIIFVSALAGLVFAGALWLIYASHCFMHVLTDSSAGMDEVRWPFETILDWWWKPVFCLGLLLFWSMVAGLTLAPLFVTGPVGFAIFFGTFLWLVYPISLFSTMHAQNWLTIVDFAVVGKVFKHFGAYLIVALATLPLSAAAGASMVGLVLHDILWLIPAILLVPAALLFYARGWGRLAWLVLNAKERAAKEKNPLPKGVRADTSDPWAAPAIPEIEVERLEDKEPEPPEDEEEEEETEWSPKHRPYGVMTEDEARRSWKPDNPEVPESEDGTYDAGAPLDVPKPMTSLSDYYEERHKKQLERDARAEGRPVEELQKKEKRPTFARALGWPLWLFLFYPPTLRAWFQLVLASLITFGLLRLVIVTSAVMSR